MRSLTGFVLLPLLALMAGPAAAESSVTRFVCVFDRHVTPDLGIVISSENPLKLELVVDATGHAFAVGRNVYPVRVHTGDKGVTFLEELVTESGPMNCPGAEPCDSRHSLANSYPASTTARASRAVVCQRQKTAAGEPHQLGSHVAGP